MISSQKIDKNFFPIRIYFLYYDVFVPKKNYTKMLKQENVRWLIGPFSFRIVIEQIFVDDKQNPLLLLLLHFVTYSFFLEIFWFRIVFIVVFFGLEWK